MSQFYSVKIKDIRKETPSSVCVTFDIPEDIQAEFNYESGQYITLKATIKGEEVRRDYSLCSSPFDREWTVGIKALEEGKFSRYANDILKSGDILEIMPPNGRFVFIPSEENQKTNVFFAAGSGITPIFSIIRTQLKHENQSKIVLVYGNKTPQDSMFLDELKKLEEQYRERFKLFLTYTQYNEDNSLFGRIDGSIVNYALNKAGESGMIDRFYLCGPEEMINNVKTVLTDKGFSEEKIMFELFTSSAAETEHTTSMDNENCKVSVIVDDEETNFNMPMNKTILEEALKHDVDAPYSCQGGICSTCIARIKEGEASMRQNQILTDSEIAEGLILTCQAEPRSSELIVDYDDV